MRRSFVPGDRLGHNARHRRFRSLLGAHCGVDPQHVHAYVCGEHGDSEVLTWSLATIGNLPIDEFAKRRGVELGDEVRSRIDAGVRRAAYTIINGKGATYYGIGSALSRIVDIILHDQRAILTVCTPAACVAGVEDVTVSLPRLVAGQGILDSFEPALNSEEQAALAGSARVIRDALDSLDVLR